MPRGALLRCLLIFKLLRPRRSGLQSVFDQIHVRLRRRDARFGLLLKYMQYKHPRCEPNCVYRAISVAAAGKTAQNGGTGGTVLVLQSITYVRPATYEPAYLLLSRRLVNMPPSFSVFFPYMGLAYF